MQLEGTDQRVESGEDVTVIPSLSIFRMAQQNHLVGFQYVQLLLDLL